MSDLIGYQLGNYRLLTIVGRGGSATVYKAQDMTNGQNVAIKVIRGEKTNNPEFVSRFDRERRLISNLQHPHIVPILNFGQTQGIIYLVMRYLEGGSLEKYLEGRALTLSETARIFNEISPALSYAHLHGIVHRDLKPSNILLDKNASAFLTDFGIAKTMTATTGLTTTNAILGTPAHMAPEQWRVEAVDARTDIYALGVLLYIMLTGEHPFKGDTMHSMMYMHLQAKPPSPRSIRAYLPAGMDKLITRALAKKKDDRYPTVQAMMDEFNEVLYGVPGRLLQYQPPLNVQPGNKDGMRKSEPDDGYETINIDEIESPTSPPSGEGRSRVSLILATLGAVLLLFFVVSFVLFRPGGPFTLSVATPPSTPILSTPTRDAPSEAVVIAAPTASPTLVATNTGVPTTAVVPTATMLEVSDIVTTVAPTPTVSPTFAATATPGVTVTLPVGATIKTYSLTAAQLSRQARFLLRDPVLRNNTKFADIGLNNGTIVFVWTGAWKDLGTVTQRITLAPQLDTRGELSLVITKADIKSGSAQGYTPLDLDDTVLRRDANTLRGRALLYLLLNYTSIAQATPVLISSPIYISRITIADAGISIDRIMP